MKKIKKQVINCFLAGAMTAVLFLAACGQSDSEKNSGDNVWSSEDEETTEDYGSSGEEEYFAASETEERTQTMEFMDVYGILHVLVIDPTAILHDYDVEAFCLEEQQMLYTDTDAYSSRLGIDVSYYQGTIDWEQVKEAGFEFAFLRIGYRGYGEAGVLVEDEAFRKNLAGAQTAGLDVGVYFYAQAVSDEEAEEEARFVLELLGDTELELPVVYDPEYVLDSDGEKIEEARTSALEGEQVTQNTLLFCEAMEEAGYAAAFYSNLLSESEVFDMTALAGISVWYADYSETPQTPYAFTFWQYSESGTVPGIEGAVDLNIQLMKN